MKQIVKIVGITIGAIVFIVGGCFFIYTQTSTEEFRGSAVTIGDSFGYIMSQDRYEYKDHPMSTVLYKDRIGQWHIQKFPNELLKPYVAPIIPQTINP